MKTALGSALAMSAGVDLIGRERGYALGPDALGLAHGDPDVGVDHVRALARPRSGLGRMKSSVAPVCAGDGLTLGRRAARRGSSPCGAQAVKCMPIFAQPTMRELPML